MSKAPKSHTRTATRKHHDHAKSPATAKRAAGASRRPREVVKRPRAPATAAGELPSFLVITEEHYFESPDDELDDEAYNDELDE